MSRPLVSVVVIFLDAERFLREAIDSVLQQSYDSWELLLVDDGSSDGSTEVAREYAGRLTSKVRYLEHPEHRNRGMSASRNLGIRHASGDYLAFLDADDVWLPTKLEQQVAILSSTSDVAMVYGRSEYWFGWTGRPEDVQRDYIQEHLIAGDLAYPPPELLALFLAGGAAVPPPSSILARSSAVREVGGFEEAFRGDLMLYEDQAFYAKLCSRHAVFVSSECLDRYRQHPESICASISDSARRLDLRQRYLSWLGRHLAASEVSDPALWRALRREVWLARRPRMLPARLHGLVRWVKKWVLKAEEQMLPPALRRRLWTRPTRTGQEHHAGSAQ